MCEKHWILAAVGILVTSIGFFAVTAGHGLPQSALESLALVGLGSLVYGVVANVCYFAGPAAELYLVHVFDRQVSKKMRYGIFGAGLAFSMMLTC